ncbi:MAG: hypothetical protein B9S33_03510 [Pedosphaera sp. Tous-C6FEB]|nr:MAG: hypothetical protein B9S33_03510 [Pedosphaera sp. Tous-C6FEB]
MIWGIVPLYFGLLLNELTSSKATFRTAIQTGFSFIWASVQWLYPHVKGHDASTAGAALADLHPINLLITLLVLMCGVMALVSGLIKKFPRHGKVLGHTRFANYFMITIFPIQMPFGAANLPWTWDRLLAIATFAVPIWLILHYGLMPLREAK